MESIAPRAERPAWHLLIPLLAGLLVAETLGILARELVISPDAYPTGYFQLFFSDPIHLKMWFATAAVALGLTQPVTAAWLYGKLPWRAPGWLGGVHRWTGRLAFVLTIPVAYHCVFKLGFQTYTDRLVYHSFFGVALYGAFTTKVLVVRMRGLPGWALPLVGGLLLATLVGAWWTSALYWFRTIDASF